MVNKNNSHPREKSLLEDYGILSSCNFWILCEINFLFDDLYTAFTNIENVLSAGGVYVLMIGVFKKRS